MKRGTLAFVFGGVLAPGPAASGSAAKWLRTLSGKTVEQCRCVPQKDRKLYRTLAKKTVDSCCYQAARSK